MHICHKNYSSYDDICYQNSSSYHAYLSPELFFLSCISVTRISLIMHICHQSFSYRAYLSSQFLFLACISVTKISLRNKHIIAYLSLEFFFLSCISVTRISLISCISVSRILLIVHIVHICHQKSASYLVYLSPELLLSFIPVIGYMSIIKLILLKLLTQPPHI